MRSESVTLTVVCLSGLSAVTTLRAYAQKLIAASRMKDSSLDAFIWKLFCCCYFWLAKGSLTFENFKASAYKIKILYFLRKKKSRSLRKYTFSTATAIQSNTTIINNHSPTRCTNARFYPCLI